MLDTPPGSSSLGKCFSVRLWRTPPRSRGFPYPPSAHHSPLIFRRAGFSRSCRVRDGGWGLEQGVRRKTVRVCAVLRLSARRPGVTSGAAGRIRAARWLVHPGPGPGSAGGCCESREGFGCGGWCTLCKTAEGKRMTRIGVLLLFRRRGRRPAARARQAEPPTVACAGAPSGALSAHGLICPGRSRRRAAIFTGAARSG